MTDRDAIVATLVAGTSVSRPVTPSGGPGEWVEKIPGENAEGLALASAGVMSLWISAGAVPADFQNPALPAPAELRRGASSEAMGVLETVFAEKNPELLGEWLRKITGAGVVVPPETTPVLLDFARANPVYAASVAEACGERGAWLTQFNPTWRPVSVRPDWVFWETAPTKERPTLLVRYRESDTARARALLEAALPAESAASRAALIRSLETGLSLADEPLLERALDDRSREVRESASTLLASMRESAFSARMTARALACFALERTGILRRKELKVSPPAESDRVAIRDGVDEKTVGLASTLGDNAHRLVRILAATPPSALLRESGLTPAEFFELAAKTEWNVAIRAGIRDAMTVHRDGDWAKAWLESCEPSVLPATQRDVLRVMSVQDRTAWILRNLRVGARPLCDNIVWLESFGGEVPEAVGAHLVTVLRATLASGLDYALSYRLAVIFSHIPVSVVESADAKDWNLDPAWQGPLKPHLAKLRLRAEILRLKP